MRVEPLTREHVLSLRIQPSQAAWQSKMTPEVADALASAGGAFAVVDDKVVAIGGIEDRGCGRGLVWSLLGDDAGRAMLFLTRAVLRHLYRTPYRRLEMVTAIDFEPARRWAIMLGFRSEGVMASYFEDGSDGERWARVDVRV